VPSLSIEVFQSRILTSKIPLYSSREWIGKCFLNYSTLVEVTKNKKAKEFLNSMRNLFLRNKLIVFFFASHVTFAIFLGRLFAFAPDEKAYLFTFNNIYTLPINTYAQSGSGWITAPTVFLWVAYLPAKILNLVGLPDYVSIRLLAVVITTLSLLLLLKMNRSKKKMRAIPRELIFFSFFIPSVFLWTSTGLREAFIIFEVTLFLVGLNYLLSGKSSKGIFLLFVGSYGLLSTKPYLWVLMMIAVVFFSVISFIFKLYRKYLVKFVVAGLITPLILFAGTTSQYALNFIFNGDVTEVGLRSGDSITQIEDSGTLITFHGDYTLIALRFYLLENPDSALSMVFRAFNLDDKVESLWNEKLQTGLISESKKVGKDTSSLNGHILKPGLITEPLSMLWPAFVFLAGPFPFVGEPGIAAKIASLESPLWWLLYTLVFYQFFKFRKFKLIRDPAILFSLIFLAGEIAFSSLVEVNLGTSFRHRSILLVPLVFIYLRITQRAHELRDAESKPVI
jgi:hypothetical protein